MEKEALSLLKRMVTLKDISLYDLNEKLAKDQNTHSRAIFDETISLVHLLTSHGLVELQIVEGDDGAETVINITELGKTYLESRIVEKALKGSGKK